VLTTEISFGGVGMFKSCGKTATAFSTEACYMCAVNPTYRSRDGTNYGLMPNRLPRVFEIPEPASLALPKRYGNFSCKESNFMSNKAI